MLAGALAGSVQPVRSRLKDVEQKIHTRIFKFSGFGVDILSFLTKIRLKI